MKRVGENDQRLFHKTSAPGETHLVMADFHLAGKSRKELEDTIAELRQLGVQKVAPCHCTGDLAISMFAEEWGSNFIANGVGRAIEIGD